MLIMSNGIFIDVIVVLYVIFYYFRRNLNLMIMNKQPYLIPEIEILDIQIENGFAQSNGSSDVQSVSLFDINQWSSDEF